MNIIGQSIEHPKFGHGIVMDLTAGTITVRFQSNEKKFIYPDAFKGFLELKDTKMQQHLVKQVTEKENKLKQACEQEQAEWERRQKLLNFKVSVNSHAVFNVLPEQMETVQETNLISTGQYLSGYSKGQPRVAGRLKPNSVCLLTECPAGQPERERKIAGAFMVREDFFGEEACDGMVPGHPQYRLYLPEESKFSLWECLDEKVPLRWGSTAFKYCSGTVMNEILSRMVGCVADTEEKDAALAFYQYFCSINHLNMLSAADGAEQSPAEDTP